MAGVRLTEMTETPDTTVGDRRALEQFFADHYGRLVGLAGLVCGDVTSAEDIVQTALERAWRSRHAILDDARIRPWLDKIVVREAARERHSRMTWLGRVIRPPKVTQIEAPAAEVVDLAAGRFPERLAMRQAFAGLSPAHRAVVVLVLDAGYSIDEAAELLGVPRETVRSRLRVAREQLRYVLQEGD
jgi:RNA polymerase sigma-70 factor, ECF subfamily